MSGRVCSVEGCGRKHKALGLCNVHYYENSRNGRTCTLPDCDQPYRARGLCSTHYQQAIRGVLPPLPEVPRWDELRCADAEWLLDSGEIPENIARRLGVGSVDALMRGLQRAGRKDLAARLWRLEKVA